MAWRVSEEHWSRVWIRGCGVQRGLQVTFGGGGGLGAAFGRGVGQEVGVRESAVALGTAGRV